MDGLEAFEAREGVRRTIALYAQLLDGGRLEAWGALFEENARFSVYGRTIEGRDAIVREIGGMQPPPDRPVKHVCLLPVVDLVDGGRARAWTDFSAFATGEDGAVTIATIGRYHDELIRAEARWRFAARTIVMSGEAIPAGVAEGPNA